MKPTHFELTLAMDFTEESNENWDLVSIFVKTNEFWFITLPTKLSFTLTSFTTNPTNKLYEICVKNPASTSFPLSIPEFRSFFLHRDEIKSKYW